LAIIISPSNPDPLYKQVTDQIKDMIGSGSMKAGDRLPSIREISEILKVSPITIKRAYFDLESEGYIVTRPGLGCFVSDIDEERVRSDKLEEIRQQVGRLLQSGGKYRISPDDLIRLIKEEARKKR
jgi:GntR family transcriptional regulator